MQPNNLLCSDENITLFVAYVNAQILVIKLKEYQSNFPNIQNTVFLLKYLVFLPDFMAIFNNLAIIIHLLEFWKIIKL